MSGGLSNADFRALLATPRHGGGGGGRGGGEGGEKKKGGGGKKPGKGFKPGGKLGEEGAEKDEGPQDRAAERRKGLSSEFEGVPDDLVGLLEGQGGGAAHLSIEDSKYLGGDVAHTHLVKGLDFALLRKVRAEQEAGKAGKAGGGDSDDEGPVLAKPVMLAGQSQAAPVFKTPLGSAVHAFFFDPASQRGPGLPVHELFLPRRTAFVFELDGDDPLASGPDVPTTLRRAKEDCPRPPDTAMGALDAPLLDRIAKIMSYMAVAGGGRKKLKKKEREALLAQHGIALAGAVRSAAAADDGEAAAAGEAAQQGGAAPPPRPADDDEDIFGDAGTDYAPTIKDKERAAKAAAAAAAGGEAAGRRGGYFGAGGEDTHDDLPPLPKDDDGTAPPLPDELGPEQGPAAGPARPPAGYDAGAAYGAYPEADAFTAEATAEELQQAAAAAARQERERQKRRAAELLSGGDDAYAECYPSYYDAGTVVEDSDEEGAAPADQQQALTRRDFASEADWEEYQASGMAPRQAEGRAKVRAQQKEASKGKSKMANELGKIKQLLEEKGYDHGAAFAKPPRVPKQSDGGGEGGEGGGPVFTKKRRI